MRPPPHPPLTSSVPPLVRAAPATGPPSPLLPPGCRSSGILARQLLLPQVRRRPAWRTMPLATACPRSAIAPPHLRMASRAWLVLTSSLSRRGISRRRLPPTPDSVPAPPLLRTASISVAARPGEWAHSRSQQCGIWRSLPPRPFHVHRHPFTGPPPPLRQPD